MTEERPDPDELLKAVGGGGPRARGQLKIFFGACAGVGKTYAMLEAAHQQQAQGVAVGLGIVETHGREETRALTEGLFSLPLARHLAGNMEVAEFDVDGALISGLTLVVVDELAHSNAPGSRHAKRWQDVEELLDAGISVFTSLNVQHLDSLNDVVGGILGIRVRETLPDHVFDNATEVQLIDLPSDDLLARLTTGKVYVASTVHHAKNNFFRRGNLIALRELALRRVADRVNADVRTYQVSHAIRTVWPTRELLVVCVSADVSQEGLIREGARLAARLRAKWLVVHVESPQHAQSLKIQQALAVLATAAQHVGVEFVNISGHDTAKTLAHFVRQRNVTKLIVGSGANTASIFRPRGLAQKVGSLSPQTSLILLNVGSGRASEPRWTFTLPKTQFGALFTATAACLVTTTVAGWLLRFFDLSNVVMLFLVAVVFIALKLGRLSGALASILSVAFFDFFFVEPRFSFAVTDTQYIFTCALMLAVALIIGQLATKLRYEALVAREGERRASVLVHVTRDLAGAIALEQIVTICRDTLEPLFDIDAVLILPDEQGRLTATKSSEFADLSVAQWAYEHAEEAGKGTQTLFGAPALYLPLKAPMAVRGVLAIRARGQPLSVISDSRRLLDACCSAIGQTLERIHFVSVAQDTIIRMEGEKMRNTLLSAVSHDLKTPLTAIRGLAETLEHPESLVEAERVDIARSIRIESDELKHLVTNLLDLARIQSGGVRLNKDWHAISEIVGSALARSTVSLGRRHIAVDIPNELPLVRLDAMLFERVLINLLDNAGKYTPTDSSIIIRAGVAEHQMRLTVQDDGPGLPDRSELKLFEPFARGQKESAITGVGLGLSLCRRIVEAHGGSISARPAHPQGAQFDIVLPLLGAPEMEVEDEV